MRQTIEQINLKNEALEETETRNGKRSKDEMNRRSVKSCGSLEQCLVWLIGAMLSVAQWARLIVAQWSNVQCGSLEQCSVWLNEQGSLWLIGAMVSVAQWRNAQCSSVEECSVWLIGVMLSVAQWNNAQCGSLEQCKHMNAFVFAGKVCDSELGMKV